MHSVNTLSFRWADMHHAHAQHGRQMPSVKEDLETVTRHGVLFVTYSLLISGARQRGGGGSPNGGDDEGRCTPAAGLLPALPYLQVATLSSDLQAPGAGATE